MDTLKDLVQEYSVKKDRLIKQICAPRKLIGIPIFSYFRIEADGRFGNLSNYPQELEFFYEEKHYLTYPYLIHPGLLRSGCILTTVANNMSNSEEIFQRFRMFYLLIILQRLGDSVEGFVFAPENGQDPNIATDFFSKLQLLYKFIAYFKKKAKSLLECMMDDNFNLKQVKGDGFFTADPSLVLLDKNPEVLKYLKAVCPLSKRERECLELFQQGYTAQATGAILGISQRTVEHYIDHIKDKLGCTSKGELMEW